MQPSPAAPLPFGKYLLLEKIASGGMAEVFRAVLRGAAGFEKQVALKRILPVFNEEPEFITLFQDEARIASTLTHANIAQVFEFGEVDGSHYLSLELVDGIDLSKVLGKLKAAGQPMPMATAAFIVAEAARGLAYAHDKTGPDGRRIGIVHRDVSPPNVLVSRAGEVKVADFGIAKATGKVHKTETGVVMGKLRYMSPEQIAGDELDARSDVYSLGVILYELLAGGPMFPGDQTLRLAELIQRADIPPPSARNPNVPAELDAITMKALARPLELRYARAAELARDLSVFVSKNAPNFTREDLGALVTNMAPPASVAMLPTMASLRVVPADPAPAPQTRDLGPQVTHKTRRRGAGTWVFGVVLVVLLGSAAMVLVRFFLPGGKAAPVDAGRLALATVDAGAAVPEPPPTAAFTLIATAGPDDKRALAAAVEEFSVARRGLAGGGYEAYLTGVDTLLATLVLDAGAHAAEPPGLPPLVHDYVGRVNADGAVQATVAYVRATGELPPLVKSAARTFLSGRRSFEREETVDSRGRVEPYAAALIAVWLEPESRARLTELAEANEVLARWCEPAPAPMRHFVPYGCERPALIAQLRARSPKDPTAAALERWDGATPLETLPQWNATNTPDKLELIVALPEDAADACLLVGDGDVPLGSIEGRPGEFGQLVPAHVVAPDVRSGEKLYRLAPPPFGGR